MECVYTSAFGLRALLCFGLSLTEGFTVLRNFAMACPVASTLLVHIV